MGQVLTIARTALRRFARDRSNWFFVLVLPLFLIVLLGLQFSDTASSGRVTIVGAGDLAQDVSDSLEELDLAVTTAGDAETAQTVVARGRADAAVIIDPAAEEAWAAGDPVTVEVLPGSQAAGQASLQAIQTSLGAVSDAQMQQQALVAAGLDPAAAADALASVGDVGPTVSVTTLGDSLGEEFAGLGRFDLGAAGQLSLFVFLTSLSGAAFLIDSRRMGVTARELAAPMTANQVVAGEVLGRFAIALAQGVYIVVGTALLFGVDWGDPLATGLVLTAFCGVSAAAAIVFGAMLDSPNVASGVGIGVGLVLAALGGSMLPLELFPDSLLVVSRATPHHWAYQAYAEIQRRGGAVVDVLPQVGILVAMTLVLLPLGAWLLKRSTQRAI